MLIVGSSTTSGGSASTCFGSQTVSEILTPSIPENIIISPAEASCFSTLAKPKNPKICKIFPFLIFPSLLIMETLSFTLIVPL